MIESTPLWPAEEPPTLIRSRHSGRSISSWTTQTDSVPIPRSRQASRTARPERFMKVWGSISQSRLPQAVPEPTTDRQRFRDSCTPTRRPNSSRHSQPRLCRLRA